MFEHKLMDDLSLMYKCLKRDENSLDFIIGKMGPYIEERGMKLIKD